MGSEIRMGVLGMEVKGKEMEMGRGRQGGGKGWLVDVV